MKSLYRVSYCLIYHNIFSEEKEHNKITYQSFFLVPQFIFTFTLHKNSSWSPLKSQVYFKH